MVEEIEIMRNRLWVDDEFLVAIGHYLKDRERNAEYLTSLTEKRYTIKDTDTSYRVINHWCNAGLLDGSRDGNENGWRKFSVVDLVWLRVVMELRGFGLSLDKIKVGYASFAGKYRQIFECAILLCMMRKGISLIVFSDGYIEAVPRHAIATSESCGYLKEPAYLVISLNNCMEKVFPTRDYSPKLDTFSLTENEIAVLHELRCSDSDEISIKMKNGDIHRVDTTKQHVGDIGKLSDILSKAAFGDFTIKKANGKITSVKATKMSKV